MSRTRHALPSHSLKRMRVQNRRKTEETVLDILMEENVPFRHVNRIINYWSIIPEPWNDKPVAAWGEYHNKKYDFSANDVHWTKPV